MIVFFLSHLKESGDETGDEETPPRPIQRSAMATFAVEEFEFAPNPRQDLPLFPKWRLPLRVMTVTLAGAFVYTLVRDVLQPYVSQNKNDFYKIPILVINKALPWTSITLLALVYLPGVLASLLQLHRG